MNYCLPLSELLHERLCSLTGKYGALNMREALELGAVLVLIEAGESVEDILLRPKVELVLKKILSGTWA